MRPEDDDGLLLSRTTRAVRAYLADRMGQQGIDSETFQTLLALSQSDNISQKSLAQRISLEPTHVARMLAHMEVRGVVTRSVDEVDSRVKRIQLTPEGKRLWSEVSALREQALTECLSCLQGSERQELRRILNVLYQHLVSAPGRAPTGAG